MVKIEQDQAAQAPIAFQVADLLDGFFELRKRSPTLHGDAPVRAVQACPPFAEGSAYGWEVRYSGIALALLANAEPAVTMIDELTPGFDYPARVRGAAAAGFLSESWHQRLCENWWWRDSKNTAVIHLWTGLVAKPNSGYHLRITELFNSPHLQLLLHDQHLTDSDGWCPLVLSFELKGTDRSAIAGSVASLSPLPSSSRMSMSKLADHPWVGKRTLNYYRHSYYQQKLTSPPTRAYAKLLREPLDSIEQQVPADTAAIWQDNDALILTADAGEAATVDLASLSGSSHAACAVLRAPADIQLAYLGRGFHVTMGDTWAANYAAARQAWQQLYGDAGGSYLDNATFDGESCVHPTPGHPVLVVSIEPLVRFATRPGWSLMFEGASKTLAWGLRGIIRSSRFHSGALAFQFFGVPRSQVIAGGSVLGRCIPIPDSLQQAQYRRVQWPS